MIVEEWNPKTNYPTNKIVKFMGKLYISNLPSKGIIPIPLVSKSNELSLFTNDDEITSVEKLILEKYPDLTRSDISFNTNKSWILST